METQNEQYPQYYRKDGKCVKVISATEANTIILPPQSKVPERYSTQYPNAERLQTDIAGMTAVEFDVFKDFLFSFYHGVEEERDKARRALITDNR